MYAALSFLLILFFPFEVTASTPKWFSSSGNMGYYWEAFIIKSSRAGVGQIYDVSILFIDNDGDAYPYEYLVNCNQYNAHVTDDKNREHSINLREAPSRAEVLQYDLWFAVCKNKAGRFAGPRSPDKRRLPIDISSLPNAKLIVGKTAPMRNLVKLSIGSGTKFEEIVIYCSESVPTVYWKKTKIKIEISIIEDEIDRKPASLVERAANIWKMTCLPM